MGFGVHKPSGSPFWGEPAREEGQGDHCQPGDLVSHGAWNLHTQQALVHFRVPGTGSLPVYKEANITGLGVTKKKKKRHCCVFFGSVLLQIHSPPGSVNWLLSISLPGFKLSLSGVCKTNLIILLFRGSVSRGAQVPADFIRTLKLWCSCQSAASSHPPSPEHDGNGFTSWWAQSQSKHSQDVKEWRKNYHLQQTRRARVVSKVMFSPSTGSMGLYLGSLFIRGLDYS